MKAVPKPLRLALAVVLALAVAAPASAYVIYLRDGSKIIAAQKYEIQGDQAIITMPNGTRTSIDAVEIDREATDKANQQGYGDAVVVDDGTTRQVKDVDEGELHQRRLKDLAQRETNLDRLEPKRREEPATVRSTGTTSAGFPNLTSLVRQPYADLEVASQIQRAFRGQGIDGVELYQGTQAGHLLAEVTAASEASVFRSLEIAAEALIAAHDSYPQRIQALELLLTTPDQERAGQFVLTSALARELVSGGTEVSRFYVQHVQF